MKTEKLLHDNRFYAKLQWFLIRYLTSDVASQNNIKYLQDLIPQLSFGLYSLIVRASKNTSFSQLSDLLRIRVFSRTVFIWRFMRSTKLDQMVSNLW